MVSTTRSPYLPVSQEENDGRHSNVDIPAALASGSPSIYYNEGEFSPPSSIDEEPAEKPSRGPYRDDEEEGERDPFGDEGMVNGHARSQEKNRPSALKALIISLVALVLVSAFIGIFAARSYNGSAFRTRGRQQITLNHIFNGTFRVDRKLLHWVPEAGDGVFSVQTGDDIVLVDLKLEINRTLVSRSDVKDEHGRPISWSDWKLSPDMRYLLLKTDHLKQWRHSSFGNYYVHNLADHTTVPIASPSNPPKISYATWSPIGNSISYVSENDLYIIPNAGSLSAPLRITSSGNASLFHGVPDWVYEEEVFEGDHALWWSPDASRLAFLRSDETSVETFDFPVYNPTGGNDVHPYPEWVSMRYPKPGYDNPLVSVHVFSLAAYLTEDFKSSHFNASAAIEKLTVHLKWDSQLPPQDSIISEVTWVANDTLIVKELTRGADDGNVIIFNLESGGSSSIGRVVRRLGEKGEEGDKGWIDQKQAIFPLTNAASVALVGSSAYLDVVPNSDGFNHIALFSPADSNVPRWLTSGNWEVVGKILNVDHSRGLVYFLGASPSGIERHLYSVPIPTVAGPPPTQALAPSVPPTPLTNVNETAYHTASFSPEAGYYVLSYHGPLIPWQKVVQIGNATFDYLLTTNDALNKTNNEFQAPLISRSTIESEGYDLNVLEMRPPGMDDSGRVRYPVLFRVYGGPGSQMVDTRFNRDWHDYVVCTLKYIVVVVDGRGTGFKGRHLRNPVRGTLGYYETIDQINAARFWATKRYVDSRRIGIWGWSYGGFMTSKVIEADAGIHSLGMAVAPVVSWRMYDSVYTERYMKTPQENPDGYLNASITNVTGFNHANFLLAHGSGDDNVHFANSAHLLDMFTQAEVRDFRFRMFTDSDHSISTRGANRELYEWMTSYLVEKWGKGPVRRS